MSVRAAAFLLALCLGAPAPSHAHVEDTPVFTALYGDHQEIVRLDRWQGKPLLVIFWRSDCAPCLQELAVLPEIAEAYSDLAMVLIALDDVAHTQAHLPTLPAHVPMLVAHEDARTLLTRFGNDRTLALPYSVMLNAKGAICAQHYGILSPHTLNKWRTTCAKRHDTP